MAVLKQIVGDKEVSTKTGLIVVFLSFLSIALLSALFSMLSSLGVSPLVTSTGFWLSGGTIAAFVFHRFVIRYLYTLDGVKLIVDRVFSRKPRLMEQVLLREIVFVGSKADALKKYPSVKVKNAIRKTNPIEPTCIVYKRAGETKAILIQANEEIASALRDAVKK